MSIDTKWGKTESGKRWAVGTIVDDLVRIDGEGRISPVARSVKPMTADQAHALGRALLAAAKWAEEHADVLQGYEG